MRVTNRIISAIGAIAIILASCTTIETTLPLSPQGPEGKQGPSAFDFWVESVNKGEVQWDKNAVTVADFFKYLKGKDGATGTSAYDQWKKEIESGNIENPHKKGEKWSADRNSVQDFFYFITGATGEKGEPGPQGERGEQGIQGPQGEQGQPGTNGRDGANGKDGKDGKDGAPGRDGTNGINGTDGNNGTNGTDGTNGLSAYELWKATAETGNLDNPHKKGEKWDKAKVSESDFWEYLRGADAVSPTITEKEVTPLEITKSEEVDSDNWLVEVTTTPNTTVTFTTGTTKQSAQSNGEGIATITITRNPKKAIPIVINATAEGKTQATTKLVSIPTAGHYLIAMLEKATTSIHKIGIKMLMDSLQGRITIDSVSYNETDKKLNAWEYFHDDEKEVKHNKLILPLDFKNVESIEILNFTGDIRFDKENRVLTMNKFHPNEDLADNKISVNLNYYYDENRKIIYTEEQRYGENAGYKTHVIDLYDTSILARVTYSDGTEEIKELSKIRSYHYNIWSVSYLPEN